MGISYYKLSNEISDDLKDGLPTVEDIEKRINCYHKEDLLLWNIFLKLEKSAIICIEK